MHTNLCTVNNSQLHIKFIQFGIMIGTVCQSSIFVAFIWCDDCTMCSVTYYILNSSEIETSFWGRLRTMPFQVDIGFFFGRFIQCVCFLIQRPDPVASQQLGSLIFDGSILQFLIGRKLQKAIYKLNQFNEYNLAFATFSLSYLY